MCLFTAAHQSQVSPPGLNHEAEACLHASHGLGAAERHVTREAEDTATECSD